MPVLRITATCHREGDMYVATFDCPGVEVPLTTRVRHIEDVAMVVREIVSALATVPSADVAVEVHHPAPNRAAARCQ